MPTAGTIKVRSGCDASSSRSREAYDCACRPTSPSSYDTGGRRRCYIAPERFYESSSSNLEQVVAQQLKPEMVCRTLTPTDPCCCWNDSMDDPMKQHPDRDCLLQDIFSMGCVIAELFLEGQSTL